MRRPSKDYRVIEVRVEESVVFVVPEGWEEDVRVGTRTVREGRKLVRTVEVNRTLGRVEVRRLVG